MRDDSPHFSSQQLDLLDRYLAGDATPADIDALRADFASEHVDPERMSTLVDLLKDRSAATYDRPVTLQRLSDLRARLGLSPLTADSRGVGIAGEGSVRPLSSATKVRDVLGLRAMPLGMESLRLGASPLRSRALVVLSLGVCAAVWLLTTIPHLSPTVSRQSIVISRRYATNTGQRATVTLDDGSIVTLAPETHLQYTIDDIGTRSIDLIGEAFFTVTQDRNRPFVVHTGAVTTRVLGTEFDVRRYPHDLATEVTVVRGRVATAGHMTPVVLAAGTIGRITDSTAAVIAVDDPAQMVSWTQGRLIFNNTPVPILLATLGRWYGYEFHMADTALAKWYVSAEFRTDQVAETMNTLKTVLGVTMAFDGKVVTLRVERNARNTSRRERIRESLSNPEPEVGK